MKKSLLFMKRNLLEMVRDPLLYIFCAGFPIAMVLMFQIIIHNTKEMLPTFEITSLIPGIMMFSYSLLMLMSGLLVSKDRTSAFLKRLFTSPMKPYQFIIGYFIPFFLIGFIQTLICLATGYIAAGIDGFLFATFPQALLLVLAMMPIMIINVSLGMLFGTLMNDKSAPAISSIFISGGAWMPVDTMGNFEKVVSFFPFYPSTALGRIVMKAPHLAYSSSGEPIIEFFTFTNTAYLYIVKRKACQRVN